MNELASVDNATELAITADTSALIKASVSQNTLRNYRYWSKAIEMWAHRAVP